MKGNIDDLNGEFNFVLSNHSIEHVINPERFLLSIRRVIKNDGLLVVRTPLIDSYAFKLYGPNWVNLDPPRHLTLFTRKALSKLARKCGFHTVAIKDDSSWQQFYGSEIYSRGMNLYNSVENTDSKQLEHWNAKAAWLNKKGQGDQACFIFKPI